MTKALDNNLPGNPLKGLGQVQAASKEELGQKKALPPVHLWEPPYCGEIPMVIRRDGSWHYQGSPIGRMPMVKLFSSILRHDDDDRFYLVTPVEKCGIEVEDAPFVAVEVTVSGEGQAQILTFRTHVDDEVTVDADHPIRMMFDPDTQEPSPYVLVRARLEALINRPVFYELVELATTETVNGEDIFGVWSAGSFFSFGPAKGLEL